MLFDLILFFFFFFCGILLRYSHDLRAMFGRGLMLCVYCWFYAVYFGFCSWAIGF